MNDIGNVIGIPPPPPNKYYDSVPKQFKPHFGWAYMILGILVVIVIIILISYEYKDHDCIAGKPCYHKVEVPSVDISFDSTNEDIIEYIDCVKQMVCQSSNPVIW